MYDIKKNKCEELAPLPYPVLNMATVKWADNVIVIGGGGGVGGGGGGERDCHNLQCENSEKPLVTSNEISIIVLLLLLIIP